MKKILNLLVVLTLFIGVVGCSDESAGSAVVSLSDYPIVETKSKTVFSEMSNAPSIKDTETDIKFKEASSSSDNVIALHYDTVKNGKIIITYYIDTAKVKGVTIVMDKKSATESDEYVSLISSTTSISDFNFTQEMYDELGKIVSDLKTTKLNDLTVSMKEIDENMEFSMFYAN